MNSNLTDITVVIDRSGSMASCQADAQGGLDSFVQGQAKLEGDCLFTLVEFDQEYNFVCKGVPINQAPQYTLVPRGGTALLDAVGRAILETGERLAAMPKGDRPGLVVFVIITDGQENSSTKFTNPQIKEMIERQTRRYNWQFTFLGANQDAFAEARSMGINPAAAAAYSVVQTCDAFVAVASNVERMRSASKVGDPIENKYTNEERRRMA